MLRNRWNESLKPVDLNLYFDFLQVEKYVMETGNLRDHVSRLNHRADAETSSVTCMKLAFDKVFLILLFYTVDI